MNDQTRGPRDTQSSTGSGLDDSLARAIQRQEQSTAHGNRVTLETLLAEQPELAGHQAAMLELIYNEAILREEAGETPTLAEYQQRFPDLAEALRVQWEIDSLLRDEPADTSHERDLSRIGRYEILNELGRGGIGVVYRAWDPALNRQVAIKRLRAGLDAGAEELQRMRVEAEAIAKIRHPHIVQIHDVGQHEGLPFFALEFCEGGSLAQRLDGQPMPPRDAAQLILQITQGVVAAHACDVIHRDLKPGNVLLANHESLEPKVSDFGLAKLQSDDHGRTATGSILGTPAYMAPEQAFGASKQVGPAADVYALGAILYECLTGSPPFRGVTVADTLEQVRLREPVAVRQLQPHVPLDLETIAHKCLRKDPAQRYATARQLADDLSRFLNREPILARRETWLQTGLRTYRRYPGASSLAVASLLLLLLITVGSLWFAQRLRMAQIKSESSAREAQLGQAEALVGRAHGIRLSRQPGQRFEALAAIRRAAAIGRDLGQPPEWYDPLRDEAIAALALPDAYVEEYHEEAEKPSTADISDDRRRYAIAFGTGDIQIRDARSHIELSRITRIDEQPTCHFVGNDHLLVTSLPSHSFELWFLGTETPRRLWHFDEGCENWYVSRDHLRLAVADRNELTVLELRTGRVLAKLPAAPFARELRVALHPTHPYVVLHSYFRGEIQIRNWQTGETVIELQPGEKARDYPGYTGADWSPDGRTLVVVNGHEDATHWFRFEPESGATRLIRTVPGGHAGGGTVVRFTADGDRLLELGWGNVLCIRDANTGKWLAKSQPLPALSSLRIDPSGMTAGLFRNSEHPRQFGLMSLAEGHEWQVLAPSRDKRYGRGAYDRSGNFLVALGEHGVAVMNARTHELLAKTELRGWNGINLHFDASGQLFVASFAASVRWPYQVVEGDTIRLEFAIPKRIHLPGGQICTASSRDGAVVAAGVWNGFGTHAYAGCWLKSRNEPAPRKLLGDFAGHDCAVSPEGTIALLASDQGGQLVDTTRAKLGLQPVPLYGRPRFSQDGTWWIAGKGRMRTGDWQEAPELESGGSHDFSCDGRQILTVDSAGVIGLAAAESGKILARFEGPLSCSDPLLSPAGDRIVFSAATGELVAIDLRRIRAGLKELGLDWDAPPFPAEPQDRKQLEVVFAPELARIKSVDELFDLMDQQAMQAAMDEPTNGFAAFDAAMAAIRNRQMDSAIELLDRTCELLPDSITARQWRAHVRAYQRDYAAAIADANWVLERIDEADFRLLRAEWLYHQRQFTAAIADCTRVIEARPILGRFAYGLRHLCHAAAGDSVQADDDHARFLKETRSDSMSLDLAAAPMVGQDISLRHPAIALLLAEKMLTLKEKLQPQYLTTIGLAYYRNDRFQQAADFFERSLAELTDSDDHHYLKALNHCGLALAHRGLGQTDKSRDHFDRGSAWQPRKATPPASREEIRALRMEWGK